MLSCAVQWLLFAQLFAFSVAAHWDWWLQGLPTCWQDCVANTQDGCNSRKCMCKTSENSASYLPNAVACAVSACDADEWALELVLGPLQLYCDAIGFAIPGQAMDNAYSAASDDDEETTTRQMPSSTQESTSKTDPATLTSTSAPPPSPTITTTTTSKHESGETEDLKTTVSTTITETTTDSAGNTLQIMVPIVMGPTSISTGSIVTSTVGGGSSQSRSQSRSSAPSSTTASPSPTAQTPSPVPTADPSSTLESGSEETEPPANGNGSPFENMQADSCRWAVSAAHVILGAFLALIMGL